MPIIAFTDYTFDNLDVERKILEPLGCEIVAWKEKRPPAELPQLVADADFIINQFAALNAEVIATMRKAKVIVRYGIGVDSVDLDAARAKKIPVCNVPDYCIDEVADHTLAFILACTRQVVPNCLGVRGGVWKLATPLDGMKALRDMTIGIIGFGRIGREVAARLKPFKCRVLVHDPVVPTGDVERTGCTPVAFERLLAESDVVTLHCPSTAQTRGMIGTKALAALKPGAILINLARGDLIEPSALLEALKSGRLAGAAFDVFATEPIPADHPILKMPNVVLAAHIASASVPAAHKLRTTVAETVVKAARGDPLPNVVNGVK